MLIYFNMSAPSVPILHISYWHTLSCRFKSAPLSTRSLTTPVSHLLAAHISGEYPTCIYVCIVYEHWTCYKGILYTYNNEWGDKHTHYIIYQVNEFHFLQVEQTHLVVTMSWFICVHAKLLHLGEGSPTLEKCASVYPRRMSWMSKWHQSIEQYMYMHVYRKIPFYKSLLHVAPNLLVLLIISTYKLTVSEK